MAAFASALIALAFILYRLALLAFLRPRPPAWARPRVSGELIAVGVVALAGLGMTLLARELVLALGSGLPWREVLTAGLVGGATLGLLHLLPKPPAPLASRGLSGPEPARNTSV